MSRRRRLTIPVLYRTWMRARTSASAVTCASPGARPVTRPVSVSSATIAVSLVRQTLVTWRVVTSVRRLFTIQPPPVSWTSVTDSPTASVRSAGATLSIPTSAQPQPLSPATGITTQSTANTRKGRISLKVIQRSSLGPRRIARSFALAPCFVKPLVPCWSPEIPPSGREDQRIEERPSPVQPSILQ
jgi:hypothetical protein